MGFKSIDAQGVAAYGSIEVNWKRSWSDPIATALTGTTMTTTRIGASRKR
jgi:hypothetical protein